ncbi:unnamed protein product [Ectocarpus sp. 12 AP-2014]
MEARWYWAFLVDNCTVECRRWRGMGAQPRFAEGPECLCTRVDCVFNMFSKFGLQSTKNEKGSWDTMVRGQSSPMVRYPSTRGQVQALLSHVSLEGGVLDACGAASDTLSRVLKDAGLHVSTNDLNCKLTADTHFDAASEEFNAVFREDGRRPDWIVTSPRIATHFAS